MISINDVIDRYQFAGREKNNGNPNANDNGYAKK